MTVQPDPDFSSISEPLEELAQFSLCAAPKLCRPEHGCAPYHRAWSMIRLLSKDAALPAGSAYFAPWLRHAASGGTCRVLLSGAADTGLAAMVLQALQPTGIVAEIVLADRCATTLEQNRRFAEHTGHRFELHHTDLNLLECNPVDVVLTHSFLNFIPPEAKPGLFASWARLLRPGGHLVGLQRFGQSGLQQDAGRITADADKLETSALARGWTADQAAEIKRAGADFWAAKLTFAAMEAETFQHLLKGAGFEVLDMTSLAKTATTSPVSLLHGATVRPQDMFAARRTG